MNKTDRIEKVETAPKAEKKEKASKPPKEETAPKAEKKGGLSSMAYIRKMVTDDPTLEFKTLVAKVQKAGYATKEVSIRMEFQKTRKKLALAK